MSLRPSSSSPTLPSSSLRHGFASTSMRWAVLLLAKTIFTPLANAAPLSIFQRIAADDEAPPKSADDPNLYLYLGVSVALVLMGGVFAGLTIAFMGQDETYLQVIATSGEGSEKRHATKVLNLLGKGKHWVLVTLLLGNVITNETLPVVLDRSLGGGWPAVLSSTVLIVIFGEIAPQSICVRYGLSIGAYMTPLVHILMWLLGPVAWPTAKLLDWLLGEDHGTMYKKAGLKTLVQLHKTLGIAAGERLSEDEVTIINSVLDLKEKPVGDIMTPMGDVFIMSADTVLDERMMDIILSQGYSRIPIYAPDNQRNFLGMLLVKILITYDPEDAKRVRDFALATLPETAPFTSCLDIINFFQEGKSHMVLVSDFPGQPHGALGVVTLEDVIEELIGEEIVDESDVFVDVHKAIRRMAPAPYQRFNKRASMDPIVRIEAEQEPAEADENEPLLAEGRERSSSQPLGMNGNAPTSYLVRRKSSTASDGNRDSGRRNLVPVRSNTMEIREHLKHLGPSNAASKPRETKFKSVKIKPGVGTIPEGAATTTGTNTDDAGRTGRSISVDHSSAGIVRPSTADGTEADVLLKSAGRDASDGAAALRAGYGTLNGGSNEPTRARGISTESEKRSPLISAGEASKLAEAKAESPTQPQRSSNDWLKVPGKMVVGESSEELDSVGDMQGPSREISRSRSNRGVRSGSITELEVEVGGMKKVVLETTSSSSDVEDDGDAKSALRIVSTGSRSDDGKDGTASDDTETQARNGNKARKRRGKKKRKPT